MAHGGQQTGIPQQAAERGAAAVRKAAQFDVPPGRQGEPPVAEPLCGIGQRGRLM